MPEMTEKEKAKYQFDREMREHPLEFEAALMEFAKSCKDLSKVDRFFGICWILLTAIPDFLKAIFFFNGTELQYRWELVKTYIACVRYRE